MDDLKRNGSGYVDPTAYEALKNVQKGAQLRTQGAKALMQESIALAVESISKKMRERTEPNETLTRSEAIKRLAEAFEKVNEVRTNVLE